MQEEANVCCQSPFLVVRHLYVEKSISATLGRTGLEEEEFALLPKDLAHLIRRS